jgi:hypothetical protein
MATTTIMIPEDIGIQSIRPFTDQLVNALVPGDALRLDLSAVTSPHMCMIQLIAAIRRYSSETGGACALALPATPALAALLIRAGFLPGSSEDTAFWLHGDMSQ